MIEQFRPMTNSVRWVKPTSIHLTVRFLGDTKEQLVPELGGLLSEVASAHPSASVVADRVGGFPNLRRPSVIWVGPGGPVIAVTEIARAVELKVRELGFEEERKSFKPHLTLGRVRRGQQIGDLADELVSFQPESFRIELDRLVLFKSTLTPSGPIYERLAESKLKTAG